MGTRMGFFKARSLTRDERRKRRKRIKNSFTRFLARRPMVVSEEHPAFERLVAWHELYALWGKKLRGEELS